MKDKLPKLNTKEDEKLLFDNGFVLDIQTGSHRTYKKDNKWMVIPFHTSKILHPKIIKELFDIIE